MSTAYPVHVSVEPLRHVSRLQLLIRAVAFVALGVVGLSFGTVFVFAYLLLPAFAAGRLSAQSAPGTYVSQDGPRIIAALTWFAAISAWAGLITARLPGRAPNETVQLEIEGVVHPTPGTALWRVVAGIPSAVALGILCWIGMFVWLWAALSVLVTERVGAGASRYLVGLQRWSVRLLAYQASLVDAYPPFSFADAPSRMLPLARVVV